MEHYSRYFSKQARSGAKQTASGWGIRYSDGRNNPATDGTWKVRLIRARTTETAAAAGCRASCLVCLTLKATKLQAKPLKARNVIYARTWALYCSHLCFHRAFKLPR